MITSNATVWLVRSGWLSVVFSVCSFPALLSYYILIALLWREALGVYGSRVLLLADYKPGHIDFFAFSLIGCTLVCQWRLYHTLTVVQLMAKSHFPGAETKVLRDMSPFLACNCRNTSGLHHQHSSILPVRSLPEPPSAAL
jgi:type III secretory pathway component EscV